MQPSGSRPERLGLLLVLLGITGYQLWLFQPALFLSSTTPLGGDISAHLHPIRTLVEQSLPAGRIHDFDPRWFTGYPTYYFYFPLPALIGTVLQAFMGLERAVKLLTMIGPLTLPWALAAFVLALGRRPAIAMLAALGSLSFLLSTHQAIWGGNIASSALGEYSYAMGFSLLWLYLASLVREAPRSRLGRLLPAVLLGLTALCHIMAVLVAVLASLPLLVSPHHRRRVIESWSIGFGLAAFWAVPFLVRLPLRGRVYWEFSSGLDHVVPLAFIPVALLALPGVREALRDRIRALPILAVAVVGLLGSFVPPDVFEPARLLPFGHVALHLLAVLGVWAVVRGVLNRRRPVLVAVGSVAIAAWIGTVWVRGHSDLRGFVGGFYAGHEMHPDWPEHQRLMAALDSLPPGRVLNQRKVKGPRAALATIGPLIPYWTVGQGSLDGLLRDSSPQELLVNYLTHAVTPPPDRRELHPTPVPGPSDTRALRHQLAALGVTYVVGTYPDGIGFLDATPGLDRVATGDGWSIHRVEGSRLVEVLETSPRFVEPKAFREEGWEWFVAGAAPGSIPVAAVPRLASLLRTEEADTDPRAEAGLELTVDGREMVVRTSAVGRPHIVRFTWFPNWRVEGALGPFEAGAGHMLVIPQRHEVRLRFGTTWVELVGTTVTVATIVGLLLWSAPAGSRGSGVPGDLEASWTPEPDPREVVHA